MQSLYEYLASSIQFISTPLSSPAASVTMMFSIITEARWRQMTVTFQKAQNRNELWESRWCSTWEADDENSEPIWDQIKTAEFVWQKITVFSAIMLLFSVYQTMSLTSLSDEKSVFKITKLIYVWQSISSDKAMIGLVL
jgi:hypothetical protein